MQKILLAAGVAAGLSLAVLDSLPHWGNTSLLVGGLLLALAVGVWIPLHDIFLTRDVRMPFVLFFLFVGAYAGWELRRLYREAFHSA